MTSHVLDDVREDSEAVAAVSLHGVVLRQRLVVEVPALVLRRST